MHFLSPAARAESTSDPVWPAFMGSAAATCRDRRLAWTAAGALLVAFSLSLPFANQPLPAYPAFTPFASTPVLDTALIVLGSLTAILLRARYRQLGEASLLALACGYLFLPILVLAHDSGLAGSGLADSAATGWLWVAWYGLSPAFVAAYALLAPGERGSRRREPSALAERIALVATLGLAAALLLLAREGGLVAPRAPARAAPLLASHALLALAAVTHLLALGTLVERTRLRRRLDLWVAVALLAGLLELALSAVLILDRHRLGFYLGRAYGLIGASVVLAVLSREALERHRAAVGCALRLSGADAALRRANDALEARAAALEAEMRERSALALELGTAHEDERKRFARELHDSIGQLIAGLSFSFKAIEAAGELPARAHAPLAEARRLADALAREVHALAVRLRPTALDDMGLDAALDQLVAEWSARTNIATDYQTVGLASSRFATEVETCVYRVVQEALTNIAKHARATRVGVVVTRPLGGLSVVIEDDGAGFEPAQVPSGRLGLLGMRERAGLVGGTLGVESRPGAGTTLTLRIPAHAALEAPDSSEDMPLSSPPITSAGEIASASEDASPAPGENARL